MPTCRSRLSLSRSRHTLRIRLSAVAWSLAIVVLGSRAEAAQWPIESVYTAEPSILIPVGSSPEKANLQFPAVQRQAGKRLCVMFKARLAFTKPGGWENYLEVVLNGENLGQSAGRLINREEAIRTASGETPWWKRTSQGPVLLTFFGPADQLDQRVLAPREDPYLYVLDISDLANYVEIGPDDRTESSEPNSLVLVNRFCQKPSAPKTEVEGMAIEDLVVGYLPESVVAEHQKVEIVHYQGGQEKARLAGDGFVLVVTATGGIRLEVGKDVYFIASSFSYPAEKINFNRLAPDDARGEAGWAPKIGQPDPQTITIEAAGAHYGLTRTIALRGQRYVVEDRLQNLTDVPVGILADNQLSIPGVPSRSAYYLSGMGGESRLRVSHAENPTLLVRQADSSLGMLAEDNLYRLQLGIERKANAFSFALGHFGLDGKAQYTFQWTLYPRKHRDYWAFINEVRRDWDVNFTVQGPFQFGTSLADARKQVRLCPVDPWFEYNNGARVSPEKYLETCSKRVAEFRQSHPDLVLMGKIENNLVSVDTRSLKGGDTLPTAPSGGPRGTYGLELTREQTAVLEGSPYADSVIRTEDGRMVVDTYYVSAPFLNLMLYPQRGNYRHRHYFEQIDFMMDKVGYRGVYIDQFGLASAGMERKDRRTLDRWDGNTVDIDAKTGQIVRKYTDCALVGADARADVLQHILDKGGLAICNAFPESRETQRLPVMRFAEMENDPVNPLSYLEEKPPCLSYQAKGHLSSPIILGIRPERLGQEGKDAYARILTKAVITAMRNGCLYYYYGMDIPADGPGAGDFGPVNHMFPFTPVELHSGWLVGKERILTCVSGSYVWPGKEPPQCHRFDRVGREVDQHFTVEPTADGYRVEVKLDDWNEIAVLE